MNLNKPSSKTLVLLLLLVLPQIVLAGHHEKKEGKVPLRTVHKLQILIVKRVNDIEYIYLHKVAKPTTKLVKLEILPKRLGLPAF